MIVGRVAAAAPGFEVRASEGLGSVSRATAEQLVESALWRQAYVRCAPWLTDSGAREPIRLTAPAWKSVGTALVATARFECGLHDAPDLARRLAAAKLVVAGKVTAIAPAPDGGKISEHSPIWMVATVEVSEALAGSPGKTVDVGFAASTDVAWFGAPKLHIGDDAVLVVAAGPTGAPALVVLDPLDVHPLGHRDAIWSLLHS